MVFIGTAILYAHYLTHQDARKPPVPKGNFLISPAINGFYFFIRKAYCKVFPVWRFEKLRINNGHAGPHLFKAMYQESALLPFVIKVHLVHRTGIEAVLDACDFLRPMDMPQRN